MEDPGVVASAFELLPIADVAREPPSTFSEGELRYARSKSDPQRRLAARLAAKRALGRLLGPEILPSKLEVVRRAWGPPAMRLSARAQARLAGLGARRVLVSLTHARHLAAAAVVLLREP
ncbi:MAG: ACP synthase [Vicinamibacteria bacterium]